MAWCDAAQAPTGPPICPGRCAHRRRQRGCVGWRDARAQSTLRRLDLVRALRARPDRILERTLETLAEALDLRTQPDAVAKSVSAVDAFPTSGARAHPLLGRPRR